MRDKARPSSITAGYIQGEKVSWFGVFSTIVLTIFKGLAGVLGRSQAMVADALESAGDTLASVIVLVSLRISRKPVDAEHPYGHGKAETIGAGIIGFVVTGAGIVIIAAALRSIFTPGIVLPIPGLIALIAAIATIVIKEGLFQYVYRVGKRLNSPALIASAWDHRKDAITSIATLVGIAGARLGYRILDPVAALVVSVFILRVGFRIVRSSFTGLMDTIPSAETIREMAQLVAETEGVEHVDQVKARSMGQYILADVDVQIDAEATVAQGHSIANEVKRKIMRKIKNVADVTVHVNPHMRHD